MASYSDSPMDRLWKEYSLVFRDYDDLTLTRWMAQTLGQLAGRAWRLSHPLVGTYRLAAQQGNDRQVWHQRLAAPPRGYTESPCCRAPLLPLFTRDIHDSGLICQHCGESCVAADDLPTELRPAIRKWAEEYADVHAVAHWDDAQRKGCGNYDGQLDRAAERAEQLLAVAARELVPKLLEHYPALIWEDQDECLEVRPEDIRP